MSRSMSLENRKRVAEVEVLDAELTAESDAGDERSRREADGAAIGERIAPG